MPSTKSKMAKDLYLTSVRDSLSYLTRARLLELAERLQIAIYVAAGGGTLGAFLATDPKNACIDMRVRKLPYPRRDIMKMIAVLGIYAELLHVDKFDNVPFFHAHGVF